MADSITEEGLQMTEQNTREYVSEGLHDVYTNDELHSDIDPKQGDDDAHRPEVPPLQLVNYLNITMLLINIFFPVVFVGFDILGNGVKLKDNVVCVGEPFSLS
jgi:hypothetical protein